MFRLFPIKMQWIGTAAVAASLSILVGCQGGGPPENDARSVAEIEPLPSPAGEDSRYPHLAVDPDQHLYLSWFEDRGDGAHALLWSRFEGGQWTEPGIIAEGDSFFVNWADFPTLLPLGGDRLVAHWPWKSGDDTYAYDVRLAYSTDGGESWSRPIIAHEDGTPTEHGFVTLLPEGENVRAFWLDGRNFAGKGGHDGHGSEEGEGPSMTLRTALLTPGGQMTGGELLDERTCDCCPTSAVITPDGMLVAYRDRDELEVRDISVIRFDGERWSEPQTIHADGWKIAGCPVNGAALDALGQKVVAAWYSEAGEDARMLSVFSADGGRSFGEPLAIHTARPIGRVDAVQLEDGSALILWVELEEPDAVIRLRQVQPDGSMAEPVTVSATTASRASGFPRMVRSGDQLVFAWTEVGEPTRVRLATARLTP
jgi:hypothetical protein